MVDKTIKKLDKTRLRAVYAALTANIVIAIVKWVTALMSDSAALLSEAFHSSADSINSIVLLIGIWSARKPPDDEHPYGYGKDTYFWSLMAAIFMLGVISTGSVFTGYQKVVEGDKIENFTYAYIGLVISLAFEAVAVYYATHSLLVGLSTQLNRKVKLREIFYAFRVSETPSVKLVFVEDLMAFTGALVALIAIMLVNFTGIHAIDGYGAMVIGIMLGIMALVLANENRGKLIGTSAPDRIEEDIYLAAMNDPPVREVADLKTMVIGPNRLLVHMTIELDPDTQVDEMDDITADLERKIIKKVPQVTDCFIEVIADEDPTEPGEDLDEDIIIEDSKPGDKFE
jgi:cation diffusion facilitator family transporter